MGRPAAAALITYPIEPSQQSPRGIYPSDQNSGMVHCPVKTASIAVMRCGEFQDRDGCAAGCKYAATQAQIAEVNESIKTTYDLDHYSDKTEDCPDCGEKKYKYRQCKSATCAPEGNQRYRHFKSPHANPRRTAAVDDLPNCSECGDEKLGYTGSLCRKCAAKKLGNSRPKRQQGVCTDCGDSAPVSPYDGKCLRCYQRAWRADHRAYA